MTHPTQHGIMTSLLKRSPRRYSELRPKDVEGNVFMYHLREVMAAGLVEKVEGGYGLTSGGKKYVEALSSETLQPHEQPYILVDIACKNESGEWLLFRQGRQPFDGLVGFPSGLVRAGEPVLEQAQGELMAKTGLTASLHYAGTVISTTLEDDGVSNAVLSLVYRGIVKGGELRPGEYHGQAFWKKLDQAELAKSEYFPALAKVVEQLERTSPEELFFGEHVFQ
ncbi:MAG: NUDIX domain-containing protein [bacterium]